MLVTGLLSLFLSLFMITARAQDSVRRHPRIIARVDSLNNKAVPLIRQDAGRAFTLLTQAELLATEYNYLKGLAIAYLYQAEVLSQRGYSKRALELYYRSMQLSRRNHDIYNVARAEQHISSIKRKSGGLKEAEKLLYGTLKTFTDLNMPIDVVNIQLRLGLLKADQKRYDEARRFLDKAYLLSRRSKYRYGEKKSYYNRALLLQTLKKPDSAIYYLHKALHLDTLAGDTYGKALSYIELSKIYIGKKEFDKAMPFARLAHSKADSTAALALVKTSVQLLLTVSKAWRDKDAIIQWQDELIYVDNTINERERKESSDFIDALRMQEQQQVRLQQNIEKAQKRSEQQKSVILLYTGFLIVFVIVVFALGYNYKKAKKYTTQLNAKNNEIQWNLALLDKLNTEITKQNKKLEDDNALKNKLLSIISHDLRKPLATTQSLVHLVNEGLLSQEETKDLFGQLEAQYTRVMALTDNLLFWIRAQLRGVPLEKVEVNLHQIADNIIEEQKIPISDKNINVDNILPAQLNWLTEAESLRIVFRNLLNNAIKFTPAGGRIEISAETTANETSFTVKDTGIGMSTDVLERINSENYYSTKGTQNEEGSGFGLMVIRDLIKKLDGKLQIKSMPGKGSAFTITFQASSTLIPSNGFVS
ncbi:tetratricopeptide repeat-containing sensor histidine kinase [Mucilaginibacter sp. PAMB04168]|uniref:tetratricopeptide repeat-containing sensor histidine kinase n=1 Tax=Mucilaginibacter sp. PAMB04168 TaxID=3138567 RepID=UPI0031F68C79